MIDGMAGGGFLAWLILSVIVVVPFARICIRAGFSGWLALLVLVPIANIVFLYFLAFADWPAQRIFR